MLMQHDGLLRSFELICMCILCSVECKNGGPACGDGELGKIINKACLHPMFLY